MKKILFSIITFLCLLFPINILAREGITSFYIDANVLDNGDVKVKELIILNGTFNGFERIINYKNDKLSSLDSFYASSIYNADDIELLSIKDIPITTNTFDLINSNGTVFEKVNTASKGDYGKYIESINTNGYSYLIYNPSNGKERGFYLEYIVKNYSVVHNDIGELYMNLFDSLTEYIDELEMYIHVPNNINLMRAWAHGPLTGEITIIDQETVKVEASSIEPNTAIDVRLVFDKDVLSGSNKLSNINALDSIIEVETERADSANKEREEALNFLISEAEYYISLVENNPTRNNYNKALHALNYLPSSEVKTNLEDRLTLVLNKIEQKEANIKKVTSIVFTGWIIGLILIVYYFYKKYDKEYNSMFKNNYYRDIPAEYGPEIVSYLLHKKIDNKDLSACLMNLIYKKIVTYEETYYGKKNKKTYLLTPNIENKDLTSQERYLIEFLLENKPTTLEEIQKRAKSNYNSFITGFTTWKGITTKAGENENFYEKYTSKKGLFILYSIFGILLACVLGFNKYKSSIVLSLMVLLLGIVSIIYFATSTKKSKKGNEDYHKWMGLKKFLKDFSNMDKRELPEVTLWEKYLVYALPLGCASKLAKDMEIRIKEFEPNMVTDLPDFEYFHRAILINNIIDSSVSASIRNAYAEKSRQEMSNVSSSSSSSGGGFGGGFSSGGGFGGGGGGGGRF